MPVEKAEVIVSHLVKNADAEYLDKLVTKQTEIVLKKIIRKVLD